MAEIQCRLTMTVFGVCGGFCWRKPIFSNHYNEEAQMLIGVAAAAIGGSCGGMTCG